MKIIEKHMEELNRLCKKHCVEELYVFGSILTDNFSDNSDIDFLVRFYGIDLLQYFDNYMDFKDSLAKLFERDIDLVEIQAIRNPILKRSIDRNKTIIYGRANSEMAL